MDFIGLPPSRLCALATLSMDVPILARAAPIAAGVRVVIAGVLHSRMEGASPWSCCRMTVRGPAVRCSAEQTGLAARLGSVSNVLRCDGLTVLLPCNRCHGPARNGLSDRAITAERLAPAVSTSREASGQLPLGQGCF